MLDPFENRTQLSRVSGTLKTWSQYQTQYFSLFFSYILSAQPPQIDIEKRTATKSQKMISKTIFITILAI